jgi:hypothetical protein
MLVYLFHFFNDQVEELGAVTYVFHGIFGCFSNRIFGEG